MQHLRKIRSLACWLVCTLYCAIASPKIGFAENAKSSDVSKCHEIVLEASQKQERALKSGRGVGRYRYYRSNEKTPTPVLVTDAAIEARFDDGKYHLTLKYDKDFSGYDKRNILFDGSTIATSRFSPRIHPVGAEGDLYKPNPNYVGAVRPYQADFYYDVSRLGDAVTYVKRFLQNIPAEKMKCEFNAAGDIVITHQLGTKMTSTLVFEKATGFRGCERRDSVIGGEQFGQVTIKWRQKGDQWYVASLTEVHNDKTMSEKWELEYSLFLPDAKNDQSLYKIEALGLPGGSRLIDRRDPKAPQEKRFRYIPKETQKQ